MEQKIDCTGLQCPAPVLKTKELLEKEALEKIDIVVDNEAAVENISRFLSYNGFTVSVDSNGITSTVSGQKPAGQAKKLKPETQTAPIAKKTEDQQILVMISSTRIGKGDDELGGKLMVNFVKTLKEMGKSLWKIVFVNHGVTFSTKESALLKELSELEQSGVHILVCGACLTHLGLLEDKVVGETTNMLDIVTAMQVADKVINL